MPRHCPNPDCPGLARDGAAAEFVDRVSHCLDCGGTLMLGAAPEDSREPPTSEVFRTVFVAWDAVQAHLVRHLIEAEKIVVYLKGERLIGAIGELPADVSQLEVQVPEGDFEAARLVVREFERGIHPRGLEEAVSSLVGAEEFGSDCSGEEDPS